MKNLLLFDQNTSPKKPNGLLQDVQDSDGIISLSSIPSERSKPSKEECFIGSVPRHPLMFPSHASP